MGPKILFVSFLMLSGLMCVLSGGCAGGDPNCIRVEAGRPFIAQEGMRYYLEEGGITYQFNQNAYPNAQVVYVDPGECQTLQPNRTYVMLVDPTYLVRVSVTLFL